MSSFAMGLSLSPLAATLVFAAGCLMGHRYRNVWKAEGPRWQLWLFGTGAGAAFLTLAFLPLEG